MTKKKKLNEAPLNVWGEHLNEVDNSELSERILELDTKEELSKDEAKELSVLLAMEKGLLAKSREKVESVKKVMHTYYNCLNKIVNDDRLITLFNVRIADDMENKNGSIDSPEEMELIFKKMMEEDMDVEGHDKLKEEFNEIVKSLEHGKENCGDPTCAYCGDIKDHEYDTAFDRLNDEGYFDPSMSDEQKLVTLMVTIIRLESMLIQDEPNDDDEK